MCSHSILSTERLILRKWQHSDQEPFARMNADPEVMEFLPRLLSRTESDLFADRIESHFRQHGFGLYAAELRKEGSFIGFIGLNMTTFDAPFTPCFEVGWRLAADFWGQGLATEGAREILDYGFAIVGLREIVSFTVPANVRSRRVMEKLGMTHDPADDFDHPRLPPNHPLRRHVLYRLQGEARAESVSPAAHTNDLPRGQRSSANLSSRIAGSGVQPGALQVQRHPCIARK